MVSRSTERFAINYSMACLLFASMASCPSRSMLEWRGCGGSERKVVETSTGVDAARRRVLVVLAAQLRDW